MSMQITQIVGVVLTATSLALLLRQYRAEYALFLSITITVGVVAVLSPIIKEILGSVERIGAATDTAQSAVLIMKALGISFLAASAADICRDAGESAMAARVEVAGKVTVLSLAMPMAFQLIELLGRILER